MTTTTTAETTWPRVYHLRFGGREMDQATSEDWETEMRLDVRDIRTGEIASAIRSLAQEEQEAETQRKFPPTQTEIAKRIKKLRWRARQERESREPGRPGCGVCRDGWIYFQESMDRPPVLLPGGLGPGGIGIPCRCTMGETILHRNYLPMHWPELEARAREVIAFQTAQGDD